MTDGMYVGLGLIACGWLISIGLKEIATAIEKIATTMQIKRGGGGF